MQRYLFLDALRGIVAVSVMLYHITVPVGIDYIFPHAPLAVDFFFILNGFVIASAYEKRLASSEIHLPTFLIWRTIRLYPMIVLGTLLGAIVSVGKVAAGGSIDISAITLPLIWGLLLLPFGRLAPGNWLFPLNGPMWSLFYEAAVNALYGKIAPHLSRAILFASIATGAIGIFLTAAILGNLDAGAGTGYINLLGGTARVVFSFFAGVALARYQHVIRIPAVGPAMLGLILIAILSVPSFQSVWLFELGCVLVVFPMLVLSGSAVNTHPHAAHAFRLLGDLSYPLYAIHYPIFRVFLFAQEKYALEGLQLHLSLAAEIVVIITASMIALWFYDEPVRRYASRKFDTPPAPPASATAG